MINADAVKWAREYEGELHHAMLCDPPYHLTSITDRFGKKGAAQAQEGTDGAFRRASAGFMGQEWDGGDVAFRVETWEAFKAVLYPGAFGFAFASTRGLHRMMVAIEDAGFVIHPTLFLYAFGSGFPKATRVKVGEYEDGEPVKGCGKQSDITMNGIRTGRKENYLRAEYTERIPATDLARAWAGHRYSGQALKPACEPIICFQRRYEGRPLDCITQTGAGALNIDAARIGSQSLTYTPKGCKPGGSNLVGVPWDGGRQEEITRQGRWPSNLLIEQGAASEMMDRQSGTCPTGLKTVVSGHSGIYGEGSRIGTSIGGHVDNATGASRFFFRVQSQIDDADPLFYTSKAGRTERDAGLDWMPLGKRPLGISQWEGQTNGSGQTMGPSAPARNCHPTVKPLSLTRYLASLLLPPAEYAPRRLFVPFGGVGSECIGAELAGWEVVNAVEQSAEYCEIGRARRRFWKCNAGLFEELTREEEEAHPQQASLF